MNEYYFGPWPQFPGEGGTHEKLFSEKPIVVFLEVVESESSTVSTSRLIVKGFGNIKEAQDFVTANHDPAKSVMYAFRNESWERIDVVAE